MPNQRSTSGAAPFGGAPLVAFGGGGPRSHRKSRKGRGKPQARPQDLDSPAGEKVLAWAGSSARWKAYKVSQITFAEMSTSLS